MRFKTEFCNRLHLTSFWIKDICSNVRAIRSFVRPQQPAAQIWKSADGPLVHVKTVPFPIFVGSLKKVKSLNHLVRFNHLSAFNEF